MDIRKYYKDFKAEDVFENKKQIKVTRTILYLNSNIQIFIDCADKKTADQIVYDYQNGQSIKFVDYDTEEHIRELYINPEQIKFIEIRKSFALNKKDFDTKRDE